jgi:hypothetical protein
VKTLQFSAEFAAFHKAGHAVICMVERVPFEEVSIIAKGDIGGYVRRSPIIKSAEVTLNSHPKFRRKAEQLIKVALGGDIAAIDKPARREIHSRQLGFDRRLPALRVGRRYYCR